VMPMPKGKAQRVGTQKKIIEYVADYFGYLINVLGVPYDDSSLAQVACVTAIESYLKFKRDGKPDELEQDRVLSKHNVKSLLTFDQILDLLVQDISFRDKLKPIPGHLIEDDVQFIQQHWKEHIQFASQSVQRLYENEIKQCKKRFDNEATIRGILESKKPLAILHDLRRAAQRAVDRAPTKFARATALRDLFIVSVIMMLCAFRPKTPCHLDWRPDGASSCFRYTDADGKEGWWIFAEKEFFKNFDQPIMQRDYLRMIQDIDGLYDYVEEYLFEARAILLDGAESDCLLVNTSTNPRFTPKSYAEHVQYLSKRLLTVDLAGKWTGVTSLTCTHVRKILATGLNKKYQDPLYTEVKNALMNHEPYIYSHDSARDRSRSTEEIVMETKDQ
jgi:hypothetical protein